MRTPRVIATRCRLCSKPIEDTIRTGPAPWYLEYSAGGYTLLLTGEPAHTKCANEATKDRLFKDEEAPGLVPER